MDTKRLQELGGVILKEGMPGYGGGYGAEQSQESQVLSMVLSNLRTMKVALDQGNMQGVQEELDKAMTMLARAKSGK